MKFIKKQMSLWRILLITGVAAIAIGIAARVRATGIPVVNPRHENLAQPTAGDNEDNAKHTNLSKAAVGRAVGLPQDDYYDRRREYWDKRVERRLDRREEYLDEQTRDDKDDASAKDKDSKDAADDEDDADDVGDKDVKAREDSIERRREYWRKRVDKEW
jgi:hypothetical protein